MIRLKLKSSAILLCAIFSLAFTVSAHSAPFIEAQIDAATAPCLSNSSVLGESDETNVTQNAIELLDPCYNSLLELDKFEKANPNITPSERNYLFFKGGYVIWITSAAEIIRNNNNVNAHICNQVLIADAMWSRVSVPPGHAVEVEINNYPLRPMLVPVCQKAFPAQN